MEENLIIDFTPTGMIPTKSLTPHVPVTVSEIIADIQLAWELGITKVHLHARIISGELMLAILLKLSELRVKLPISGFRKPSKSRASDRSSNLL